MFHPSCKWRQGREELVLITDELDPHVLITQTGLGGELVVARAVVLRAVINGLISDGCEVTRSEGGAGR